MSLTYATGIIGVVAMVMCWALAVVLYRVDIVLGIPDSFYDLHPHLGQIYFIVHTMGDAALLYLMLSLLFGVLGTVTLINLGDSDPNSSTEMYSR
jgi:hypothetical protein